MSSGSSPGGAGRIWNRIQDLLTTGVAGIAFGIGQLAVWLKSRNKKQRRLLMLLALAAVVLILALPGPGSGGGTSSRSSDRESSSRRTCLTCLGSGKCGDCRGSGYKYVRGSGGTPIKSGCNTCRGSGKCTNSQCKNGSVPFR